jgi:dihydropteroate synthase
MTPRELIAGRHRIALGARARIMGIVNATPDSFFDRGKYFDAGDPGPAIERAEQLIAEGAEIIDIGGETAQPSSPVLEPEEEIRRVVPVIAALAKRVHVPISVDTYKPRVAKAAIEAGAAIVNDTSGLTDEALAAVAAETGAGIVCMHIPCHPKERIEPGYSDPVGAVSEFLREKTAIIQNYGVPPERIAIDPGIGFGKKPEENLRLTAHLGELRRLGYALLFACSRRTFLGNLMGGEPPEQRLEATVAINAAAILAGADIIRVHDVAFMAKLAKMLGMIRSAG